MKTSMAPVVILVVAAMVCVANAEYPASMMGEGAAKAPKKEFSPYAHRDRYPTKVLFGDTHLHTSLSVDAGTFGNRLGLDECYRFTKGEVVTSSGGYRARIGRPLDWVVVTDHSDGMGFFQMLAEGDPRLMDAEEGRRWHEMIKKGGQESVKAALEIITMFSQDELPWKTNEPELMTPVWKSVVEAAEKYNEPGTFTAFIGYEWTSLVRGNNPAP